LYTDISFLAEFTVSTSREGQEEHINCERNRLTGEGLRIEEPRVEQEGDM
jgi:hypothetical protein